MGNVGIFVASPSFGIQDDIVVGRLEHPVHDDFKVMAPLLLISPSSSFRQVFMVTVFVFISLLAVLTEWLVLGDRDSEERHSHLHDLLVVLAELVWSSGAVMVITLAATKDPNTNQFSSILHFG